MITKIWSGESKLYWLLIPFALLYGCVVLIRKVLYRKKFLKSWQSPVPVIIVGNLSVGGNGKTPLVIYLIEQLRLRGYKVGVVARGYGGNSKDYPVLVTDNTSALIVGDEPFLVYQRTQVPFAVSPIRRDAIKLLLKNYELDLVITDDGLQHYALQRDIEIVVIDGKRGFGNGWLLPAGPMRESAARLNSVDYIVVNGKSHFQYPHSFTMNLIPQKVINLLTGELKYVTELKSVIAMAGIGDPNRFFLMLKELDADLINTIPYDDHQSYSKQQLSGIVRETENLLMTEKDAVKCLPFAQKNWWYLPINAMVNDDFIDNLIGKMKTLRQE